MGNAVQLQEILGSKINPNCRSPYLSETPLMLATRYGQDAAVKALLKAGASVNATDSVSTLSPSVALRDYPTAPDHHIAFASCRTVRLR